MEFGRRLAVERELEKTPYFSTTNACKEALTVNIGTCMYIQIYAFNMHIHNMYIHEYMYMCIL